MKFSILGFNQERVLEMHQTILLNGKEKTLVVDVVDLLILREIADFMNRKKIIKYTINDKIYSLVKYSVILEDLPIINIKQQALVDRLNKLCIFGLLEKEIVKTQGGSFTAFRIGDTYENIVYNTDYENSSHLYSTTSANVVDYKCNNIYNNNNTSTINTNKNEIDKSISKKSDELFETCWLAYRRKGSKKKSKEYWGKLTEKEKESVLPHIKAYVSSRELSYQKDFERYLRDKIFTTIVFNKNNVVYDPTREMETKYIPETSPLLMWNDYYKCYMYLGYWDGDIPDGYSDDDRPNDAKVTLNNGRGVVTWNSEIKKWVKNQS